MTPQAATLRRAAAHLLVDDVELPVLDEPTAHHLSRVLRVANGEVVTVTDGAGAWRACRATGRHGELHVDGAVQCCARSDELVIGVAIPKADRPEWIVQKLTELGVDRIVFLHAERSVVRWEAQRAARHLAKLRVVAREALQQSRRVWLPVVDGPVAAASFLSTASATDPAGAPLTVGDRILAIGPEGGWTDAELDRAARVVSLGETMLRVETAAVAAAAIALRLGLD